MDWQQQQQQDFGGYFPYNQPNYTYPGFGAGDGSNNTGYIEFDDGDEDAYEPDEAIEPVLPVGGANTIHGLDGAVSSSESPSPLKSNEAEPKSDSKQIKPSAENSAQYLADLKARVLAGRNRATPPQKAKQAPPTKESTMSTDVDNFIREERAAAEAVNAKNMDKKPNTTTGQNGTLITDVEQREVPKPPNQAKQNTTSQGPSTPVAGSTVKETQATMKKNGPALGTPKVLQNAQPTLPTPGSRSSVESGEIRDARVAATSRPPLGKEPERPTRPQEETNTEDPKYTQPTQSKGTDKNTNERRERREPAASSTRTTNLGVRPKKAMIRPGTNPKADQPAKATGEKNNTPSNINTMNREATASLQKCQKDKYTERTLQIDAQLEGSARRSSLLNAHNEVSPTLGHIQTQRQPTKTASNDTLVGDDMGTVLRRPSTDQLSANAAAHSHYFDDLDEWLEATGYHDREYRQKVLGRHRAYAQVDREMERIDREYPMDDNDNSYQARLGFGRAASRPTGLRRVVSMSSMGPPPLPVLTPRVQTIQDAPSSSKPQAQGKRQLSPSAPETLRPDKLARLNAVAGAQERLDQHVERPFHIAGLENGSKSPEHRYRNNPVYSGNTSRVRPSASDGLYTQTGSLTFGSAEKGKPGIRIRGEAVDDDENTRGRPQTGHFWLDRSPSPQMSPTTHRFVPRYRRDETPGVIPSGSFQQRRFVDDRPGSPSSTRYIRPRSPPVEYTPREYNHRQSGSANDPPPTGYHSERGRGRGGYRGNFSRGGGRPQSRTREPEREGALHLGAGGVRYFMIKSWNRDNVEIAQRESVWATQPHNEELLAHAFDTCRHVILVFSVNKSMAFQGYARMMSAPGDAPTPSWTKNLLWPTSGPFFIKWLTIADVRFSRVGHLKNSLNEGLAVLVGRDGQEIEEECGRLLCESMDEVGTATKGSV